MSGYTPDEKLRMEQIIKLRRQWLKDQELSPREPVVQAKPPGAVAKFWAGFLEPKSLWRLYVSCKQENKTCHLIGRSFKNRTAVFFLRKGGWVREVLF
uniref:NADH dehydrogenase [ubiquinone] 1 beta subcomplex subunit 6 n=1 Tax=Gouania willdenowi TaxID=441366 RepID=A0A8C5DDN0_GOUWI